MTSPEKFVIRRPKRIRERNIQPFGKLTRPVTVTIEEGCIEFVHDKKTPDPSSIMVEETPTPRRAWPVLPEKKPSDTNAITIAATPTIPHVVRISNLTGCDNMVDVVTLIHRRSRRRFKFIYMTECMSHVFVGMYTEESAMELCTMFQRFGHGHTICESILLTPEDRPKKKN